MQKHLSLLSTLTLADLVSLTGVISVWLSLLAIFNNQPFLAILIALLSFCIDMSDGYIARIRNSSTTFGLQLDTIVDTLNYPVFNALFAYFFLLHSSYSGSIVAVFILIFSALRLARMGTTGIKTDAEKLKYYEGVVTPHILLANILFFYCNFFLFQIPDWIMAISLMILSILMVSQVRVYKPSSLRRVVMLVMLLATIGIYGMYR